MRHFKQSVLRGKSRFQTLFTKGRRIRSGNISLVFYRSSEQKSYFAVCVSASVGSSVIRNRLKRICREAVDPFISQIPDGYYIALLPGRSFDRLAPQNRKKELVELIKKAGLL